MKRILLGSFVALMLGTNTVGASGSRTTTAAASIQLNVPASQIASYTTSSSTLWPTIGDTVTFSVTYPKSVDKYGPRISVQCYQNEVPVYVDAEPYYSSFLLGGISSQWLNNGGGPAFCQADLFYWSYQGGQQYNWLASTSFNVGG